MANATWNATKQMLANIGVGDANPGDAHMVIGPWAANSYVTREALYMPFVKPGDLVTLNEARLYLRGHAPASGFHVKGLSNAQINVSRKTTDWSETSHGGSAAVDELFGGDGRGVVNSGFVGASASGVFGAITDGGWYYIVVTQIVQEWINGNPNYGVVLYNATSESSGQSSYGKQFHSRHAGGSIPYLWIDYGTNTPPNAPTITTSGLQHNGRTVYYSWTHSDPNGDGQRDAHWQLFAPDGATLIDETYGLGGNQSLWRTLPSGYYANAEYFYRVRTSDPAGAWGAFSALAAIRPNSPPNVPTVSVPPANTLTPTITSGGDDPDGNNIAAVQLEVWPAAYYQQLWLSGDGAFAGIVYAGGALSWGTEYAIRGRTRDQWGAWSAWSGWVYWTPVQPSGPTLSPAATSPKQNTLTPTLNIQYAQAFNQRTLVVFEKATGVTVWLSQDIGGFGSVTSLDVVYAGSALQPGRVYGWEANVQVTATSVRTVTTFGSAFYVNANPTSPTVTIETDAGVPALNAGGVLVTADSTPVIRAPFSDPDRVPFGDTASARRIEIRRQDTQVALTGYPNTTGTTDTHTITTALAVDVIYEARVGFRDNAGWPAGSYTYSPWTQLKYSIAPILAGVTPANAATITDSTQTFTWTATFSGGKTQATYRFRIYDKGPTGANYTSEQLVYDSGVVTSSALSHSVPRNVLLNGHGYRWSVTVTDTDGLSAVLA